MCINSTIKWRVRLLMKEKVCSTEKLPYCLCSQKNIHSTLFKPTYVSDVKAETQTDRSHLDTNPAQEELGLTCTTIYFVKPENGSNMLSHLFLNSDLS